MDSRRTEQSQKTDAQIDTTGLPILERLFDLELPVSVAVGYADLTIKNVLKMKAGSVVQLNKEPGEEVDLLVHGTVVARGEIVLVDDNYAIRIRQIVNRMPQAHLIDSEDKLRMHPNYETSGNL